jgi:hypothetical protein
MAPITKDDPLERCLSLKDKVKIASASLDEQEKGILGVRFLYLFFHIRHALHWLAVYLQDHVTPLNRSVVSGAAGLYTCHYSPKGLFRRPDMSGPSVFSTFVTLILTTVGPRASARSAKDGMPFTALWWGTAARAWRVVPKDDVNSIPATRKTAAVAARVGYLKFPVFNQFLSLFMIIVPP